MAPQATRDQAPGPGYHARAMHYRRLGNSGVKVSEVALGSWLTFGNTIERNTTERVVKRALELGINFLDTADVYALGEAERVLQPAIKDVPRKDLFLATKCYFPTGPGPNDRGLSRKHILESLHQSLRRLGTDYVDLYQCHRYDEDTPLEEVVRAMDDAIRQGKVLYWGVSHWPAARITQVVELARRLNAHPLISNQPPYSLLNRDIETEVMGTCREGGLGLVVFSPLGQGVLTGKYRPGQPPPKGSRALDDKANRFIGRYLTDDGLAKVEQLRALAQELSLSLAVLALAWCLRRSEVASVIVGATSAAQIEENARASGVTVPPAALQRIDQILGVPPGPPDRTT